MAGAVFQTAWRQDGFYRAVHILVSARRREPAGGYGKNAVAQLSFLQPHRVGGIYDRLHPDRIFFREGMEMARGAVGFHDTLPDSHGDGAHCSGRDLPKNLVRFFGATFFQRTQAMK